MMKILVNTISTKKHAGGAFQIAQNFLLKTLEHPEIDWYYITSSDVDDAIGQNFAHLREGVYYVFPTQPDFKRTYWDVRKQVSKIEKLINPDVVYSVTAPSYFAFQHVEVMRFTNPWVTHPNKYSFKVLSLKKKLMKLLVIQMQKCLIHSTKYFITQTETCKKGIVQIAKIPQNNVAVVNNVLPAAFKSMDTTPIPDNDWINISCVGVPTPHKDFIILPDIIRELKHLGYNNVRFHTTIPEDNALWYKIKQKLVATDSLYNIVNRGRLSQKELGYMYQHCQFCFLPTLLEVFSASTVEAMYFGLPVVATDFDFNRDVMSDSCLYYNPMDAKDAANKLATMFSSKDFQTQCKKKMKERLSLFDDYDAHFNKILAFLINVAKQENK